MRGVLIIYQKLDTKKNDGRI